MPWTLPNSLTTELDAVNTVLRAKGLEAATSVDLNDGDVAEAVGFLDTADREVQSKGWFFNKDVSLMMALGVNGEIVLPEGTLQVSNAYYYPDPRRVVERGQRLYDLTNQTFTFTTPMPVDITIRLNYTDLPEAARRYIATLAAHRAQGLLEGVPSSMRITEQQVLAALTILEQQQDAAVPANQIHGNISVQGALNGWGIVSHSRDA